MYKPPYIVYDFETEACGEASTEMYRPDFYVSSCAFCWRGEDGEFKTHYIEGVGAEPLIRKFLLKTKGIPLVVHNWQFERGVIVCRFPGLLDELQPEVIDTMRLVQNYDNGGGEFQFLPLTYDEQLDYFLSEFDSSEESTQASTKRNIKKKKQPKQKFVGGLGLKNAGMRLLGVEDHKKKAHEWLRENIDGCKKGNEGSYLHALPEDLMREYNIADVITTARLYEFCTSEFTRIGFDWRVDHSLYCSTVAHIVESKIAGVRVLREHLAANIETLKKEIEGIETDFKRRCADAIRGVERTRLLRRVTKLKTLRGRKSFLTRLRADGSGVFDAEIRFNIGSNKQLADLFMGEYGMAAKFLTEKGQPAFRSAVLHQWGENGEALKTRRKRLLVLKQSEALLKLSEFDGKWRIDMRVAGTSTGRGVGSQ